jgi:hypothetical protein
MQSFQTKRRASMSAIALVMSVAFFTVSLAGCFGDDRREVPPPVDDTRGGTVAVDSGTTASVPQAKEGMSTKGKLVILAGAAALYYLYKKSQGSKVESGPESQYYLSKNGRIYYRDAEGRAHWVTPPQEGITVPASEADAYREFQGYDNRSTGMDLQGAIERGLEAAREPTGR